MAAKDRKDHKDRQSDKRLVHPKDGYVKAFKVLFFCVPCVLLRLNCSFSDDSGGAGSIIGARIICRFSQALGQAQERTRRA